MAPTAATVSCIRTRRRRFASRKFMDSAGEKETPPHSTINREIASRVLLSHSDPAPISTKRPSAVPCVVLARCVMLIGARRDRADEPQTRLDEQLLEAGC